MATKPKSFDFEASLEALEGLVESMEEGNMSLEESLEAFEKGIKLTRECQTALEQAEQKVKILTKDSGEPEVEDFDPE